jgi:hypothetical protein
MAAVALDAALEAALLAFMLLIGKKIATIPCCSTYSRD